MLNKGVRKQATGAAWQMDQVLWCCHQRCDLSTWFVLRNTTTILARTLSRLIALFITFTVFAWTGVSLSRCDKRSIARLICYHSLIYHVLTLNHVTFYVKLVNRICVLAISSIYCRHAGILQPGTKLFILSWIELTRLGGVVSVLVVRLWRYIRIL